MASKKRYIAGIDGLRLFAIIAIIIFHAKPAWLPGGYSGVTVFFVIAGYLLTVSVDRALSEKGSFSYLDHLKRRFMRLLPVMLAVVAVVAVVALIIARPLLPKMKDDVIPALLFFENWYYIVRNVSYFAAAG
ncbi:MAG: acyltransferase, partial [Atopobiaceae bacterium]|nr:acyltransferase [Atopobiaceae bacterium]